MEHTDGKALQVRGGWLVILRVLLESREDENIARMSVNFHPEFDLSTLPLATAVSRHVIWSS